MDISNLSPIQQKLINGLVDEFSKMNVVKTTEGKRFSLETIDEVHQERRRIRLSIQKHNRAMIDMLSKQIIDEIDAFNNEFGSVVRIEDGYSYKKRSDQQEYNSLETYVEYYNEHPLGDCSSQEVRLFLVSQVDKNNTDDYDFDGRYRWMGYVGFKTIVERFNYTDGSYDNLHKIVGIHFNTNDWHHRDYESNRVYMSIDDAVQRDKDIQQKIVGLSKNK